MIVKSETMAAPLSLELVQNLYDKNVELEKSCRVSAQSRVQLDPNTWHKMRENYETIILENHVFSEKHNIEYALWQLHYKRIEDYRANLFAASKAKSGLTKANPVTKIRLQFKAFLSEATGFYHDLILKIRAKTGLPIVGDFPEDSGNLIDMEKEEKKSDELKKGLISCNRCLIYLGDLARYKGLYGDGESKSGDYAAASSYYLQAASLWPSSGNPHHQLAILSTYSRDELMTVYHYFRSLAVDSPFSTAKDNLIVLFEKNRKSFSKLHEGTKGVAIKESLEPMNTEKIQEAYKAFSICFVHLNGILFTNTSSETFEKVLSLVSNALYKLLSSGPEEELNFGKNTVDNALLILRLTSILIFTVHNVKREAKNQSYADILQRRVLLQKALAAAFDLMGHIMNRCLQLSDPSSSYLLPGILVFVEYLASCPDISAGSDISNEQAHIVSKFWNNCMSFLNKLLCLLNMGRYKGETENRVALKEDLELRGFLPLKPSQSILDFSRRSSFVGDKEKKVRIERILSAGKALANAVKVDKNPSPLSFDPVLKKFVISNAPQVSEGIREKFMYSTTTTAVVQKQKSQPCFESEEEDEEVIIFKPTKVFEKRTDDALASDPRSNIQQQSALGAVSNFVPQSLQLYQTNPSISSAESHAFLDNGFKNPILSENGHTMKPLMQDAKRISQEVIIQPKNDKIAFTNDVSNPVTIVSKHPPSRPVRHLGPPPGFSSARPKQVNEGNFGSSELKGDNPVIDNNIGKNAPLHTNPQYIGKISGKLAIQSLNMGPEQLEQEHSWKTRS